MGGIAIFVNEAKSIDLVDVEGDGEVAWLKVREERSGLGEDVYLCVLYMAGRNSRRWESTTEEKDFLERIGRKVDENSAVGRVLVAGDFNCRIRTYGGTAIQGIRERKCKDLGRNRMKMMTAFMAKYEVTVVNGLSIKDTEGEFTCYSGRGRSVVDYLLVRGDFHEVSDFETGKHDDKMSDHCSLSFTLQPTSRLRPTRQRKLRAEVLHINKKLRCLHTQVTGIKGCTIPRDLLGRYLREERNKKFLLNALTIQIDAMNKCVIIQETYLDASLKLLIKCCDEAKMAQNEQLEVKKQDLNDSLQAMSTTIKNLEGRLSVEFDYENLLASLPTDKRQDVSRVIEEVKLDIHGDMEGMCASVGVELETLCARLSALQLSSQ